MSSAFQKGSGNWIDYRSALRLSKTDEVDLHFGRRRSGSYEEAMAEITGIVENSIGEAQRNGRPYVMFIHGSSTSRPGQTTARSQVRTFMRSSAATPFIERAHCIQHKTVFVAKIKPSPGLTAANAEKLAGDQAASDRPRGAGCERREHWHKHTCRSEV